VARVVPPLHSAPLDATAYPQAVHEDWRALRLFNIYRLVLALVFFTLYSVEIETILFAYHNSRLFSIVSIFYLLFALVAIVGVHRRWLSFNLHVVSQGVVDVVVIGLLMHASGGVNSGLGMLMIVAIAGSSMVTEGRTAIFFGAVASLVVLLETATASFFYPAMTRTYTHAGLLGVTFFTTAFLAYKLARRIRISETLAHQRGVHVEYLARLNEQIVAQIQSGIIVTDHLFRVRLCNQAAINLLGISQNLSNGLSVAQVSPELAALLHNWQQTPQGSAQLFRPNHSEVDVLATFTPLIRGRALHTLVVLEDATLTSQRAHQLKLTSLGRLTASIAHEVRNPLGAISHAAQLLEESCDLNSADKRLVQIILSHSQRVNGIIENVLQLSRQRQAQGVLFALNDWLAEFSMQLQVAYDLQPEDVILSLPPQVLLVYFDPDQLHQVLWNLCDNALRYSKHTTPVLELRGGINADSGRPYLDIQDYGHGLNANIAEHVFEPFVTSEPQGTGLGLYLSRGFCESNRASLHIIANTPHGCCFRIHFALPPEENLIV
jgi:two-component system, NtrC family, sensor histidine kinase PilS